MKLTQFFFATIATTFALAAPVTVRADNSLADELLDATHDMRAQAELLQNSIPAFDTPVSDSISVTGGGSPFTQGATSGFTNDDNTPGLDVSGAPLVHNVTSLEALSDDE